MSAQEYRHIVRIVGNDIPGYKNALVGLTQVRGIGQMFSSAILRSLDIRPNSNIGDLTEEQVSKIEKIITDPAAAGFPAWFLNRRKDVETGSDKHIITPARSRPRPR